MGNTAIVTGSDSGMGMATGKSLKQACTDLGLLTGKKFIYSWDLKEKRHMRKKIFRRVLVFLLAVMLVSGTLTCLEKTEAVLASDGETDIPTFTLKKINGGTGVKMIIDRIDGADGCFVYMTNRENEYSGYLFRNGKWDLKIYTFKDVSRKRTFTINGLPKGKYTFKVLAFTGEYSSARFREESVEKTVKINKGKTKARKEKKYDFSKAEIGDIIKFGSYEQDDNMNNGTEDIEWIVMSKDTEKMLLLSKYALDCVNFANNHTNRWDECSLRVWLNKVFYKKAFTKAERSLIKTSLLENPDNIIDETDGGPNTKDKVFIFSYKDAVNPEYGYSEDHDLHDIKRRCTPTAYAVAQGVGISSLHQNFITEDGEGSCNWWLRTPGTTDLMAFQSCETVNSEGRIYVDGLSVPNYYGVRPAIYVKL